MAFRYVVKKRVFGFDKSKSEKYVAASFSIGEISYDRLCDQVTKEGMAPHHHLLRILHRAGLGSLFPGQC